MNKKIKVLVLSLIILSSLFFGKIVSAVSPCGVPFGCTGVATLSGLIEGNGTSPFTAATSGNVITALGFTPIALTNLSASSPLSYNNSTGAFSIIQSDTSHAGYLSSTDWNTFNGKQPALTILKGTYSDGNFCTYASSGTLLNCNTPTTNFLLATGATTGATSQAQTFTNGIIAGNNSPTGNYTLTQNSVVPFTSVFTGAVVNTLYLKTGDVAIGGTSPTARLMLPAGTASANTAPLKFTSGTNLGTPEDGAVEYNGTHLYVDIGSSRYQLDQQGTSAIIGVGTSTVTGGSSGNVFYHTAGGVLGEMTTSGSGTQLALTNSPVFTTPNIGTATGSVSGNAGTATTLQTPRTINGVSFNGSANITVPSDIAPGSSGNILTSNGTVWTSASPATTLSSSQTAATSISAGQPVTSYFYQSDGGVTLDNSDTSPVITSATTVTKSFTVGNNANRILVVGIDSNVAPSVVTYNGTSMLSNLISSQALSPYTLYTYYLFAPSTGANNLVVTLGSTGTAYIAVDSLYNVKQSGQPDSFANSNASSGPLTHSITTTANGAYEITFPAVGIASGSITGTFGSLSNCGGGIGYTFPPVIGLANCGIVYPGGTSISQTWTTGQGGSFNIGMIQISLQPATTPVSGVSPSSSATHVFGQNLYSAFLGFANSSVSAGSSVQVTTDGIVTGLSGLIPNTQYYLNDSLGTIGTSPGTNTRKVGISLSTTSLLVTNIW